MSPKNEVEPRHLRPRWASAPSSSRSGAGRARCRSSGARPSSRPPAARSRGAICGPQGAAKFRQDPRSPRKSALDLFKAGIVSLTPIATLGAETWDYLDQRRVTVQRAGITRTRPAMKEGWEATFLLQVLLPQYIAPALLNEVVQDAGRLVGLADFRPTYGRFQVVGFEVLP